MKYGWARGTSRRYFLKGAAVAAAGWSFGWGGRVGSAMTVEDAAGGLRSVQDDTTISIMQGEKLLLRYRFDGVPFKPYVDQLVSPAGVQVLRDSPSDHKHHHALMYAVAVDGVNFWEEHGDVVGRQRHRSLCATKTTVSDGVARAGIVQELDWTGEASDHPMLVERRAIDVLAAAESEATLVEWRCRLAAPPDRESIVIGGHHYYGLGMRFLTSMDSVGRFLYAGENVSETVHGDERLTAAAWAAYTAKAEGRPVTVALFDHPSNVRHPARMFTMLTPFSYLSATMNAWKEPLVVERGSPLGLRYGVAVWDGEVERGVIERLYGRWQRMTASEAGE